MARSSVQNPPLNDLKFLEQALPAKVSPSASLPSEAELSGLPFNELFQTALDRLRWGADRTVPRRAPR